MPIIVEKFDKKDTVKKELFKKFQCTYVPTKDKPRMPDAKDSRTFELDQTIEAFDYIINNKINAYQFIDGELGKRKEGENIIATLNNLSAWEIKQI